MVTKERLNRNKNTQEFFTPDYIVDELIAEVPNEYFIDLMPFRESTVGAGNIAIKVIQRYKKYHKLEDILKQIQLSDIMLDNCIECIERICGKVKIDVINPPNDKKADGLIKMFKINGKPVDWIVQADATKFYWWKTTTQEKIFNNLFDK